MGRLGCGVAVTLQAPVRSARRLRVLAGAVSDGTSNLNWSQETFGYAEAHDGNNWVGVRTGEHVTPAVSGLLIHPDHVPTDKPEDGDSGDTGTTGGTGAEGTGSRSGGGDDSKKGEGGGPSKTQFYAQFDLNPVRGIKELGEILEHVTARLGSGVELHLEVRASSEAGYDDATQRIVKENASNLGARAAEFE